MGSLCKEKTVEVAGDSQTFSQIGIGFALYTDDNRDTYPPGAVNTSSVGFYYAWDTSISTYIGRRQRPLSLSLGEFPPDQSTSPKTLLCPFDIGANGPDSFNDSYFYQGVVYSGPSGRRSYSMNAVRQNTATPFQQEETGDLPVPIDGVGIIWGCTNMVPSPSTLPSVPGYKTSIVPRPAETLNLVELPNGYNIVGTFGCAICIVPEEDNEPYDYGPWDNFQTDPGTPPNFNYGMATYAQQGNRFNYLFFDGHVSKLTMQQTVGNGTIGGPRGMWMLDPSGPYYPPHR